MITSRLGIAAAFLMLAAPAAGAQTISVDVKKISAQGVGEKIGTITVMKEQGGIALQLNVTGLPDGKHGFHLHEKGDCGPGMDNGKPAAGFAAGPHYDPEGHKSHAGPTGAGHKGDLPAIDVSGGMAQQKVIAPRLTLDDVRGRAFVIHEGGDNYTDTPPNGGGKGRIACASVPAS
jgi:Cu-Zn family superoxide dismutase